MPKFIDVYSKRTGKKQRVPEHFLDVPALAKHFRKTPKTRAREAATTADADASPESLETTTNPPASPDNITQE